MIGIVYVTWVSKGPLFAQTSSKVALEMCSLNISLKFHRKEIFWPQSVKSTDCPLTSPPVLGDGMAVALLGSGGGDAELGVHLTFVL